MLSIIISHNITVIAAPRPVIRDSNAPKPCSFKLHGVGTSRVNRRTTTDWQLLLVSRYCLCRHTGRFSRCHAQWSQDAKHCTVRELELARSTRERSRDDPLHVRSLACISPGIASRFWEPLLKRRYLHWHGASQVWKTL